MPEDGDRRPQHQSSEDHGSNLTPSGSVQSFHQHKINSTHNPRLSPSIKDPPIKNQLSPSISTPHQRTPSGHYRTKSMGELQNLHLDSETVIHLPQTPNGFTVVPTALNQNNKKRTGSLGDLLSDSTMHSEEISHASSYNNLDIDSHVLRRTSQVDNYY